MSTLVRPLPDGPLDIIGDVHGELEALESLLRRLGGDPHAGRLARPAVFVGDLVDRGPDSPGVVRLVRRLVEAGQAWCVVGNHELNLLQGQRKEGNGWFHGDPTDGYLWRDEAGNGHHLTFESALVDADEAEELRRWLDTLPVVLERPDLRVVHACWHAESVARLPRVGSLGDLANTAEARVDEALRAEGILEAARAERSRWYNLTDPSSRPTEHLVAELERNARQQNDNPLRVLTSGMEEPVSPGDHFFIGGRWRFVARAPWWDRYDDDTAVVMGHYWRRRGAPIKGKVDTFQAPSPQHWVGPRGTVFCVDFSVGRRFLERGRGGPGPEGYVGGLAALRWPERTLVFDDREEVLETVGFGRG